MNILNHYVIALSVASLVDITLAIFVYLRNKSREINWTFALYYLSISWWAAGEAYSIIALTKLAGLIWWRINHIGVIFISVFFLHFTYSILEIEKDKRKFLKMAYILGIFFLICDFTPLFIKDVVPKFSFKHMIVPGIFYHLFVSLWVIVIIYGLKKMHKAYIDSSGIRRNQLKYLFWGSVLGYLGGAPNFLPAFNIEIYPLMPFGTYTVPIYTFIMAYAIIKYRLMDINIAIGKLATYSILLVIISGVYSGLMFGVDRVFSKLPMYNPFASHFLIFLLLSVALIYFIPRIKGETGKGIEKVFFKNKFKHREALREFSKKLVLIPDEEQLLTEAVNNIATAMEVNRVAIILMDDLSGNYIVRASLGLDEQAKKFVFTPQDGIIKWLTKNKKVFLVEEVDKILSPEEVERIKIELKNMEMLIYFPLIIHNEFAGVLVLGEKLSREMYSHIDIELLEDFTNQLALFISYKRLESRMMRADRLVSLGTLAAGMAHEIRNPLSSIQIFAQLLPEKYDDKEFREEFSKIVTSDTQRINRLIESVMALANPKPSIPVTCHINELLDETLFLIESNIKREGVRVTINYDKQLPPIKADKEQLRQVFLNIFLNALAALSRGNGQLTISVRQKLIPSIVSGQKEKYVQIEIKDNGTGIEKKFLERIFEPFFTTRPDGTGLGLAIVHRIVEQHRGFIKVDSEVGEGTTFLINLPLEEKND